MSATNSDAPVLVQAARFLQGVRRERERHPDVLAALRDVVAGLAAMRADDLPPGTERVPAEPGAEDASGTEPGADRATATVPGEAVALEDRFVTTLGPAGTHALGWCRLGRTVVLLLFGPYEAVRHHARRTVIVDDPATGGLGVVETERAGRAATEPATERRILDPASRRHFARLDLDGLDGIMERPIEDWMVFLHPDQAALVERTFAGPARVRGVPGTGKTVVAVHRARRLAETYGERILFTTYVSNLPRVFAQLFDRFAPEATGLVEFLNLHAWAHRFLRTSGRRFRVDGDAISQAFNEAYYRAGAGVERLRDLGWRYLREEIDWVIKGRGVTGLDGYLALARTGRGTPLPAVTRSHVWALYEEYERQLERRGVVDFSDLLRMALAVIEDGEVASPYRAVIVDEVQDLTEVGLRLAHALAGGDRTDGLFLVGDGQQSVYPGGFALAHIGIDVRGRSTNLKVNYRNTRAILDTARRVVADRPFDDGDDEPAHRAGDDEVVVLRDGVHPVLAGFASEALHDEQLLAALRRSCTASGVGPGDVAVLVPTHALVRHYGRLIAASGFRTEALESYDGGPNDRVKVGTFQRGKGLEFKHVLLPRLDDGGLDASRRAGEDEASHTERLDLLRRQLFVAMTRARDGVWGGWVGEPSTLVDPLVAGGASQVL